MTTQYMNLHLYSDIFPYEVIRWVSEKTVEIRMMKAELDPQWKPEFVAGGFLGHCVNQDEQRYIYESNGDAKVIRARLTARGWKSKAGIHKLSDSPRRKYDYNF